MIVENPFNKKEYKQALKGAKFPIKQMHKDSRDNTPKKLPAGIMKPGFKSKFCPYTKPRDSFK